MKSQWSRLIARGSPLSSTSSGSSFALWRKKLLVVLCLCLFGLSAFAADRDVSAKDLKGIPKRHKYFTSIVAGAAIGAAIGILAPGGNRSLVKGLLIGSSGASSLYLWSHPNAAGGWNQWAHVASNTGLATGVGWTVCNCSAGAGIGALVGSGGTLAVQSFGTHDPTIAKAAGTNARVQDPPRH